MTVSDFGPVAVQAPSTGKGPDPTTDLVSLTAGQGRIWFASSAAASPAVYTIPWTVAFNGPLDVAALAAAVADIGDLHPLTRARFVNTPAGPKRRIHEERHQLEFRDLSDVGASRAVAEAAAGSLVSAGLDLEDSPVFTAHLYRVSEFEHVLCVRVHHAVSDGQAFPVLLATLADRYNTRLSGASADPQGPDALNSVVGGAEADAEAESLLAEYVELLEGTPRWLDLPYSAPQPPTPSGGESRTTVVPLGSLALRALAAREGVTVFAAGLSVVETWLAMWTGQTSFLVGLPVAGDDLGIGQADVDVTVNLAVVPCAVDSSKRWAELARGSQRRLLDAFDVSSVPYERLVEALDPPRNGGLDPIVQVLFHSSSQQSPPRFEGLTTESVKARARHAHFDVECNLVLADEPSFEVTCNADVLDDLAQAAATQILSSLVSAWSSDPEMPAVSIRSLAPAHHPEPLRIGDGGAVGTVPFLDRVAGWVERKPERAAVEFGAQSLSYLDLWDRAGRLAPALRKMSDSPQQPVGLMLAPGPDRTVLTLACLLAGLPFLPLDPRLAAQRLAFQLEDSGAGLLVSDLPSSPSLGSIRRVTPAAMPAERLEVTPAAPGSLAYIIYTSGSTGKPKGVGITCDNLAGLPDALGELPYVEGQRVLAYSSPSFDASILELVLALARGGTLIVPVHDRPLGRDLVDLLRGKRIGTALLPPALLAELEPADTPAGFVAISGGDVLPAEVARRWSATRATYNAYGPTEATVVATIHRCSPSDGDRVSVGRPVPGRHLIVLDGQRRLLPTGARGEVWIAGSAVGAGYVNRPDLTRELFVDGAKLGPGIGRMYRTGDVGRWDSSGRLHLVGRADDQVQVRGYRVELGEVETVIGSHPEVREACVLASTAGSSDVRILAFVSGDADRVALRNWCRERLPPWMVPAHVEQLPLLPKLLSGKFDRDALRCVPVTPLETFGTPSPPGTRMEAAVRDAFEAVLGRGHVGVDDDFFEVGGHSLSAMRVVGLIESEFAASLPLRDFLARPTPRAIAALVSRRADQRRLGTSYPLISLQLSDSDWLVALAPAIGGGLGVYTELLAGLPDDVRAVGLESPELRRPEGSPHPTLEVAADEYARLLLDTGARSVDVVGWSFGGLLACETARLLASGGVRARALLIDVDLDACRSPILDSVAADELISGGRAGTDANRVDVYDGATRRSIDAAVRSNLRQLRTYVPPESMAPRNRVLLTGGADTPKAARWRSVRDATTRFVGGDHWSVMVQPESSGLTSEVLSWLAQPS